MTNLTPSLDVRGMNIISAAVAGYNTVKSIGDIFRSSVNQWMTDDEVVILIWAIRSDGTVPEDDPNVLSLMNKYPQLSELPLMESFWEKMELELLDNKTPFSKHSQKLMGLIANMADSIINWENNK